MILSDPTLAICSGEKYAPGIWEAREILDQIDQYMDTYGPIQPGVDYAPDSEWAKFFAENVKMYAPGIYAIRYLHPEYCRRLLVELSDVQYTVNEEEPEDAQIPEVVLEEHHYGLYQCPTKRNPRTPRYPRSSLRNTTTGSISACAVSSRGTQRSWRIS
ncbi:hypothetical protein PSV6_6 [Pseudomonas phage PSV6]|nr:hypothetical protein PSV6_6 [Pseudomonas phage PSV6]